MSGCAAPDRLDDGPPSPVGHVDVDQDDIGQALADELDGSGHLVGVPHELDGVAQLGPHPGAKEMVVVDQEDPHPSGSGHRGGSLPGSRCGA